MHRWIERAAIAGLVSRFPPPDRIAQTDPTDGDDIMLAALVDDDDGEAILGVARALKSAEEQTADFAIILRPDVEGQGLGRLLMGKLINQCRDCGLRELVAYASADNQRLIELGRAFRFVQQGSGMPGIVSLRLQLPASSQEE
jgi:acetyltransferase